MFTIDSHSTYMLQLAFKRNLLRKRPGFANISVNKYPPLFWTF